jgi:predicted membrane-bound spermidine synthase
MIRSTALALTFLTGLSGLVYQVAWQKVLASLLGSHSEAVAAVLALFLGGLSAGYALFGRVSRKVVAREGSLLLTYGIVESGIGVIALAFPWLFDRVLALSLALPHGNPGVGFGLDVGLAALLVLPPAILMGGTIPLLTQGLSRDLHDATRFHSSVYAVNTAGAFVGAIAAGFWLIPSLGLESSIRLMGFVNLAAGGCFIALRRHEAPTTTAASPHDDAAAPTGLALYGFVALLAGFAMMSLQTTLNRVGALALGASPFTFSMVVATFVLCIAFGSFAVAALPEIRRSWVAISQWVLVALLIAIYTTIEHAPYWAYVIRLAIGPQAGVHAYYAAIFAMLLALSLVPLALSGALLPLLFHHLRDVAADLGRVAGRLYAWNTAGSLIGALLGGYLLLFFFDLDEVYKLAVAALAVGAALLTTRVGLAGRAVASGALVAALVALALLPGWRAERMAAGLFRLQIPLELVVEGPDHYFDNPARFNPDGMLFHTDDPSATVSVLASNGRAISVNGKSDGNIPGDNMTTGLLALLPALMAAKHERAFVIGWGTGMTVGELAALDGSREVVVAEISPGVIEAAPFFEALNRGALGNPKTRIIQSDAYRALLRDDSDYDVIVSEPSNPWVIGVENLYSLEFLRAAEERLAPGGVYAQWFHTYETDDETVALVLATFREAFDQVAVWRGRSADLILLGFEDGDYVPDIAQLRARAERPDFSAQLEALPLTSFGRLVAHEVLPAGVLHEIEMRDRLHTLMHPILGDRAARAFYRRSQGRLPPGVSRSAAETGARSSLVGAYLAQHPDAEARRELMRETCALSLEQCATLFARWTHDSPDDPALAESLEKARTSHLAEALAPEALVALAALYRSEATADAPASYEDAQLLLQRYLQNYHHGAPFSASALHATWKRCAESDPRCRAQLDHALAVGASSPLLSRR